MALMCCCALVYALFFFGQPNLGIRRPAPRQMQQESASALAHFLFIREELAHDIGIYNVGLMPRYDLGITEQVV